MSAALKLSDLVPASSESFDEFRRDNHDIRPQPIGVDISEIEVQLVRLGIAANVVNDTCHEMLIAWVTVLIVLT